MKELLTDFSCQIKAMYGNVAVFRITVEAFVGILVTEMLKKKGHLAIFGGVHNGHTYWRQVIHEVSQLLIQSFHLLEPGWFMQFVEKVGDVGYDLGEAFTQDDEGRARRLMERLGDKSLSGHDFGEFQVHRFLRIAVGVDDRWRSTQYQRIAKAEHVSESVHRASGRVSHSLSIGVVQEGPHSSPIFGLHRTDEVDLLSPTILSDHWS